MSALTYRERRAEHDAAGLLILHHGRGADESDLLALGDQLDPGKHFHVVTPRAPLTLAGSRGHHWYVVPRVGYPDYDTFHAAYHQLAAFHDTLWRHTGIPPSQAVLGGFSMGAVMSYALGLAAARPAPAGILAFSGFVPTVEDWEPAPRSRVRLRAFIAHGRRDPVMAVHFAREARDLLEADGLAVEYHESDTDHRIDPQHIALALEWLARCADRAATPPRSGTG